MTEPAQQSASDDVIAVIGATGQQGGATARALLANGARVRALARDTDSAPARKLADAGAEIVRVDLDEPESIRTAVQGANKLFAMTTMTGPDGVRGEVRNGRDIADAAVAVGVEFLLYSSVGAAERHTGIPHFDSKREVEQYIEGLDIASTFVRPVFFMENLLGSSVDGGEAVVSLPFPDDVPLQMVAVADIGRVAAAILLDPAAITEPVEIAGDELTGSQIAQVFGSQAGLPGRYQELPLDVLGDDADARAMFEWFTAPVAYQADLATTRRLDPEVMDTAAWLASTDWSRS